MAKRVQSAAGTSWQVIAYNNGKQAVVRVALGTTFTANLDTDSMLTGNAGINNYSASYKTDGKRSPALLAGAISIGQATTTRKMCAEPPNVMEQETQYLQALSTAATYRIDGSKMEFRTADGALTATFHLAK